MWNPAGGTPRFQTAKWQAKSVRDFGDCLLKSSLAGGMKCDSPISDHETVSQCHNFTSGRIGIKEAAVAVQKEERVRVSIEMTGKRRELRSHRGKLTMEDRRSPEVRHQGTQDCSFGLAVGTSIVAPLHAKSRRACFRSEYHAS
jgi:hypothetical protein